MSLVNAWPVLAQLDRQLVADEHGVRPERAERIAARRAYLVAVAVALAEAALRADGPLAGVGRAGGRADAAHTADSNG